MQRVSTDKAEAGEWRINSKLFCCCFREKLPQAVRRAVVPQHNAVTAAFQRTVCSDPQPYPSKVQTCCFSDAFQSVFVALRSSALDTENDRGL